jgi:ribonuclease P protein component
MLNRRNRIGESGTIERLAKAGSVFKSDFLLFRYSNTGHVDRDRTVTGQRSLASDVTGESPSRFAVNVSKKIDKRAVYRNRLRRQINEALRLNLALLPNGYRVLVSARASVTQGKPGFKEFNQAVLAFFNTLRSHAK